MKNAFLALGLVVGASLPLAASAGGHATSIAMYVTPYYNSKGPAVNVGSFSAGLASKNDAAFVGTIQSMKRQWDGLAFYQLYVGAVRLYDNGYRDEAVYWFYTAQYRGRQFSLLADPDKLGTMGQPGFELYQAQNAFFQLAGPTINGYAFGNLNALASIARRVASENRNVPNLPAIYPGVAFKNSAQWSEINDGLSSGLMKMAASLSTEKSDIRRERVANGVQATFANVTSKRFPGGF